MSAHADANEILRWLRGFKRPPSLTCLVHGEPAPMDALKSRIERELRLDGQDPRASRDDRPLMSRRFLLEQVDDAAVVQYYADGFDVLPLEQKILAWHLYQAALAGRDIYYDQRYRHALEMREILEEILTHHPAARQASPERPSSSVIGEIRRYAKLFWINSGPYGSITARKFVMTVHPRGAGGGRPRGRVARCQISRPRGRNARRTARSTARPVLRSRPSMRW